MVVIDIYQRHLSDSLNLSSSQSGLYFGQLVVKEAVDTLDSKSVVSSHLRGHILYGF